MANPPLPILAEDNHLLVVSKRSGIATQGALPGEPSVHSLLTEFIKRRDQKPGNVYLGIVSRLDAPTSGVVVLAKTSKAAARLSQQFRDRQVEKTYLAVLSGMLPQADVAQSWMDHLRLDDRQQRMVQSTATNGQEARLTLRVLEVQAGRSLVHVRLETGRKHQIRVQAALRDCPAVGDAKYGGPAWRPQAIALHAVSLRLQHPTLRQTCWYTAAAPETWKDFGFRILSPPRFADWVGQLQDQAKEGDAHDKEGSS